VSGRTRPAGSEQKALHRHQPGRRNVPVIVLTYRARPPWYRGRMHEVIERILELLAEELEDALREGAA
jgi:hypothetical protein